MTFTVPAAYDWVNDPSLDPLPRMTQEALKLLGTIEGAGAADNPMILGWANQLGLEHVYTHDAIPWCGLFMALVATRAGKTPPDNPLWALNWAHFGTDEGQPRMGDVLVFARTGGGHVTQYLAEDQNYYHCLGGNQSDCVCIEKIAKVRLYRVRRPIYTVMPASARSFLVGPSGAPISTNEA